jgi:hypothetical protein
MRHYNSTPPTILAQKADLFPVPLFHKLGGQERNLPEVIHHLETAPLGLGIAVSEIGPERRRDNTEGIDGMAKDIVFACRWRLADFPIGAAIPKVIAGDIDHGVEPVAQPVDDGAIDIAAAMRVCIARE